MGQNIKNQGKISQNRFKTIALFAFVWLFIGVLVSVTLGGRALASSANLVTNPGAETGDTSGWTITANGGNQWGVDPGAAHTGTKSFETSFGWDIMNQKIDLLSNGFTQNQLDTTQPAITFSNWVATRGDQGGKYFLTYKLLGSDGTTVISSYNFGTQDSPLLLNSGVNWFQQTYSFNSYGSGVRYAYMEIGGRDQSGWAGHYGTHFDDASITVSSNELPNAPSSLGAASIINGSSSTNKQPSFSFALSDSDSADTLKYQIQVDDSSDFSSPVVSYTSALAAQGSATFTVGQTAGSGSYTTGSAGQILSDGSYYWRVKAMDNNGAASAYTSANSSGVAFRVDTAAPTISLNGSEVINMYQGSSFADPGATATDSLGGNLTSSIIITGAVNTARIGTYALFYTVTDAAGNSSTVTRIVKVLAKPVAITASSAEPPPPAPTKIVLNDFSQFFSSEGKTLDLPPNGKVYFSVEEHTGGQEEHSITVKSIDGDTVTITVASTPFDITMRIGDIKYVDVNKDGVADVSVRLLGIVNGLAQIVIRQLPKSAASSTAVSSSNNELFTAIGVCGFVLLAGLTVLYIRKNHAPKKRNKSTSL